MISYSISGDSMIYLRSDGFVTRHALPLYVVRALERIRYLFFYRGSDQLTKKPPEMEAFLFVPLLIYVLL